MHEHEIARARRRLRIAAGLGGLLLAATVAALVFPVVLLVFLPAGLLGAPWGVGAGLWWATTALSAALGVLVGAVTFAVSFLRAPARAVDGVRAWPSPRGLPRPPQVDPDAVRRAQRIVEALALAAGVPPPRVGVVADRAPNCPAIGRRATDTWIVVTAGLLELPRAELEAVLAYELGRIAVLEVSLDTVVYACTARTFEVWAGAFGDFDESTLLLAPVAVVLAPVVLGGVALRAWALRIQARLSDGLAIRYCRNPVALVRALRRIADDPAEVRRASAGNAHLWLEYPHTRSSRVFLGSRRILRRRIARLERLAALPAREAPPDHARS